MTAERLSSWTLDAIKRSGWPAIALFSFHVIASRGFDAYERFPPLDIPMHILGGVVIAYFFHGACLAASSHRIFGQFHRVTHMVLVFALTGTATVFWEFGEFISDRTFGTHAQLGLEDTLGDMLLGICGGILLLFVTQLASRSIASESTGA
jgi:hypothetical protein